MRIGSEREIDAEKTPYNPFDLTKAWPHGDYPLIEGGQQVDDFTRPRALFDLFDKEQKQRLFANIAAAAWISARRGGIYWDHAQHAARHANAGDLFRPR